MKTTLHPISYDPSDVYYKSAEGLDNPIGKGTDSTVYSRIYANSGKVVDNYVYYQFDFSGIPDNATINSITLTIKGASAANSSGLKWFGGFALYLNRSSTLVDTTWWTTTATATTYTATTVSRSELDGVEIKITGYRSILASGSTSYYIDFYGADLEIDYTVPSAEPPVITIQSQDKNKISSVSGYDRCTVSFTSDQALSYWEARATTTQTPAHGTGLLVESGTLAEGEIGYVYVDDEELTNGDTEYTISIFGQNVDGVWSDE